MNTRSRLHAYIGTFRQLEILLAVYDCGSITAAAETLHLTQPTVSMQLKKLGDAVGMPLYESSARRTVFTEVGEEVVRGARDILERVERLDMRLADFKGLKAGTLRLGVVTTAKYFIPHLLGDFCTAYPNINVQLNVANRSTILERLDEGLDDYYVFSHPPESERVELQEFLPNPLVAIAPIDHPLTRKRGISLEEFCREPFLMREQGSGTRHAIEEHFRAHGVQVNTRMTIESNEAIKHAVMSGLGVSVLSSHTLAYGGHAGLEEIKVAELPIMIQWHLARLKDKPPSTIAEAFLDYVNATGRKTILKNLRRDLPSIRRFLPASQTKKTATRGGRDEQLS